MQHNVVRVASGKFENRRDVRRETNDRRDMIRFEPVKDNRRGGFGRRQQDKLWDAIQSRY